MSGNKPRKKEKKTNKCKRVVEIDNNIEVPPVWYRIHADDLANLLYTLNIRDYKTSSDILSQLKKFEDLSLLNDPKPIDKKHERNTDDLTIAHFDEKYIRGLFYLPGKCKYKYIQLHLAPSTIQGAGLGVFAVDPIPKGSIGYYRGISRKDKDTNGSYSWQVFSFSKKTGEPDDIEDELYNVDATDALASNWARYVNCGVTKDSNNIDVRQCFDKIQYITMRTIERGEELFVDYGPDYRKDNLGIKY